MALIVGIGASAGGLDAFKRFFANMPSEAGMAFVLVQHLSPDHKSLLAELLGKVSSLDVIEAVDGVAVKANCVFVIPPDATMTIGGGRLAIVRPAPPRDRRRPIDSFLQSLAEDQGENAIGIILSGTGSDGALGLASVKEHGGLTLAQAEFDSHALPGMPEAAANTGLVDDVLLVEDMPARLVAYQRHLAQVADGKGDDGVRHDTISRLSAILRSLHSRTGHDFSRYKEKTLLRRLQRRMQVLQVNNAEAYMARLVENPEELDALLHEMLIGVTQFFRDPAAFDALDAEVLKGLVAARGADDEVRAWVPGCATGEEVYSIAILLREAMDARRPRPKVQIFGTDLDERAIATARLGRYAHPIAGLSVERAARWFTVEGPDCCVVPEIREMCVFSPHSLIKHPPFSKLDLISCRNLLIYFNSDMQDRVMRTFHYGLKPGGTLFLGSSESVTRATKLFAARDKKHRIFERRDVPGATLPPFSTGTRKIEPSMPVSVTVASDDKIDRSVQRVMEKHYPAHLVVDRGHQIIRFSGGAIGGYLEPSPGAPSFALFDILRKALRPAARELLHELRGNDGSARREEVAVSIDGKPRLIHLTAERLAEKGAEAGLAVLAFHDAGPAAPRAKGRSGGPGSSEAVLALEQELRTVRTQLQSTIDELETASEEMKSTNEEYQSVNEELQSSNEELETAKEEMQSINEELQTINTEIAAKNEQLTLLNSDLTNLLESTDIATLFLDENLRVRRFTRGVGEVFHLREADIGRPITEIVSMLDYGDLKRDVANVLRKLTPIERQVSLQGLSTTFVLSIRPYRTIDNVIDGVVLTFVDITDRQAAAEVIRVSEAKFRTLFEYIDEGFCILEKIGAGPGLPSDFRYIAANPGFAIQCGIADVVGKTIREVMPKASKDWFDIYDRVLDTGQPIRFEMALGAHDRMLESFAFRFDDGSGNKLGVIFIDISHRKLHEEQQELLLGEMDHRVKNLFAIASGVVGLSARSAKSLPEMASTVQGRLGALANAHQLVRPRRDAGAPAKRQTTLREVVKTILRPYAGGPELNDMLRAEIDGPDIPIGGDAVTSFAMILHELATNAAKYGAFSSDSGKVRVAWEVDEGRLALSWQECGGPPVNGPPKKEGFGSMLAKRSIAGQLDGSLDFEWNHDGLIVRISATLERLAA